MLSSIHLGRFKLTMIFYIFCSVTICLLVLDFSFFFLQLLIYSHWDFVRYSWYLAYDSWNIIGFKRFSVSIEFLFNIWENFFAFSIQFVLMLALFYSWDVQNSSIFLCRSDTYISENTTVHFPIMLSIVWPFN